MNNREKEQLIKQEIARGEIIVTTRGLIKEAVREAISLLRAHDNPTDPYCTETHTLYDEEINDLCDEVIDYLTD